MSYTFKKVWHKKGKPEKCRYPFFYTFTANVIPTGRGAVRENKISSPEGRYERINIIARGAASPKGREENNISLPEGRRE